MSLRLLRNLPVMNIEASRSYLQYFINNKQYTLQPESQTSIYKNQTNLNKPRDTLSDAIDHHS